MKTYRRQLCSWIAFAATTVCVPLQSRLDRPSPRYSTSQNGGETVVPYQFGQSLDVTVPLMYQRQLEDAILRVSSSVKMPLGIERIQDPVGEPNTSRSSPLHHTQQLTGLSIQQAFSILLRSPPLMDRSARFNVTWPDAGGVIHIAIQGDQQSFLDNMIDTFDISDATLVDAALQVHRLLDPTFTKVPARGGMVTGTSGILTKNGGIADTFLDRRISLSLHGVPVRAVLDSLVLRHGAASWMVRYRDLSKSYAGSEISFASFLGRTATVAARR